MLCAGVVQFDDDAVIVPYHVSRTFRQIVKVHVFQCHSVAKMNVLYNGLSLSAHIATDDMVIEDMRSLGDILLNRHQQVRISTYQEEGVCFPMNIDAVM